MTAEWAATDLSGTARHKHHRHARYTRDLVRSKAGKAEMARQARTPSTNPRDADLFLLARWPIRQPTRAWQSLREVRSLTMFVNRHRAFPTAVFPRTSEVVAALDRAALSPPTREGPISTGITGYQEPARW